MKIKPAAKGMTLIEVMITVAILAIVIAIGSRNISSYQWMNKEIYYSSALRQGERQKNDIETASFDSLPPEVLIIPENGVLKLSNKYVDEESIRIYIMAQNNKELSSQSYTFNPLTSEIHISTQQNRIPYKGEKALVSYAFLIPDSPEPVLVPETEPYRIELFNSPIQEVVKVEL